jgi:hypothetical protein
VKRSRKRLERPSSNKSFGGLLHEEFHALWLDNRHRILNCQRLFTGTADAASVYPREVVRAALSHNACAVNPADVGQGGITCDLYICHDGKGDVIGRAPSGAQ